MAGQVRSGTLVIDKAGTMLSPDEPLDVLAAPRFVSRGGEKLDHALESFGIAVTGQVCADFGASTGGFTDSLLQRGALRVYAIDVGYGQLHYRLRTDERVVVMERVNVRHLESLPELVDLVVVDVSFISLKLVLPAALRVLKSDGRCVVLIKPQFEAGRDRVGRGGVVRDKVVHRDVLQAVTQDAREIGFSLRDLTRSPLKGPAGNVEFLALLVREAATNDDGLLIEAALADSQERSDT